jgi:hypothetical protein
MMVLEQYRPAKGWASFDWRCLRRRYRLANLLENHFFFARLATIHKA